MSIPTHEQLMLPVLRSVANGPKHIRDLISALSDEFGLSPEERAQLLPSGTSPLMANRVHWVKTYLKQAGLVSQPARAIVEITPRGRDVLSVQPSLIDRKFLMQFPEFQEFQRRGRASSESGEAELGLLQSAESSSLALSPEERIDTAAAEINAELRTELLAKVLEATPDFFERLVLDLLLAMGYGGSRAEASEKLGRTGDGGVDGLIREDRLGLDGALNDFGAQKGIIITTSRFTKEAIAYADRQQTKRIVLIDGEKLTDLMVRFGVGVRQRRTVDIKGIDLDYFDEADLT